MNVPDQHMHVVWISYLGQFEWLSPGLTKVTKESPYEFLG